ncbi:hypothetical protein GobsT_03640 [Gemmata obscuriglobus]|uniref:Uncharacterized protein n=1 Tax=Gemmata obscuriglobus TaxID=114 RepID=A0A2Z3H841_9BACT|nr:hypothetical protein C1280_31345 [Gemmata obscuriglobus]QEG25637.1 hypothetical protein GobsT_03640 [Gemmata obscuriglobus]VTR99180.1 Uncharacterized protein OS=Clostridium saccharoperbutylacetonicum N1-4(HMT) GN=Cspa_c24830 PE=4 SV=1 [Gemmata obscuriglobus UQM 2246]
MQTAVRNVPSSSDLLKLRGTRPLFAEELRTRIAAGSRCVRFEYCFSLLFVTVRRQSPVYLTGSWQVRYLRGLWFSLLALALGPWGVPWGLAWTLWSVWINTTGGVDCTTEIISVLEPGARVPETGHGIARPADVTPA